MSEKRFTDVAETPREELECEKKYLYEYSMFWECNDGSKCQILEDDVVRLLNEQQELIEELHISDNMGWGRAEKFEKELKQKKIYIKRLEYKVQKFKEMNGEQQSIIEALKKENDKLYHWKSNDTLKEPVTYEAKEEVMIKLDKGVPL